MTLLLDRKPLLGKLPIWTPNPAGIPTPVGAWMTNEGGGSTIFDTSGNNTLGALTGNVLFKANGIDFGGASGDFIDIVSFAGKGRGSTSHSWVFKIKRTNDFYMYDQSTPRLVISLGQGGDLYDGTAWRNFYAPAAGVWLTMGVVADAATSLVSGYEDGDFQGSDTYAAQSLATGGNIKIGAYHSGASTNYDGEMEFLYIFNVALTAAQMAYISLHPYYAWEYPEIWQYFVSAGVPSVPDETHPATLQFSSSGGMIGEQII